MTVLLNSIPLDHASARVDDHSGSEEFSEDDGVERGQWSNRILNSVRGFRRHSERDAVGYCLP